MRFAGFIGPSYTLRSSVVDCQRCVNMYPEIDELGTGKEGEVAALVGTPGLSLLNTMGGSAHRCGYEASNDKLYVVVDNSVYYVDSNFNKTLLGTIGTNTGPVNMADDGFNLIIVDGSSNIYDYNFSGATFNSIAPGFSANQVQNQFGYFILNNVGTNMFFLSDLPSGSATADVTFNNIQFASAQNATTRGLGILSSNLNLWLFNETAVEIWYFTGANDFPFQIQQGAYIEHGAVAPQAIAKSENTVFWIGRNNNGQGVVYMASGYNPQKISNHAVELAIQSYGDLSTAVAYTYQSNGHTFYCVNFNGAQTTWVFDTATGLWHERVALVNGQEQRHIAQTHAFAYNMHVVGDYQSGNLYALSDSVYTDNGNPIRRLRRSPHISQDMDRITYQSFQLDLEPGDGTDGSGQGVDPQIMLRFSDDGGQSWSNEKWTAAGKIGHTKSRAIWRRLGYSRNRVFEVSMTDPIKTVWIGAKLELKKEAS